MPEQKSNISAFTMKANNIARRLLSKCQGKYNNQIVEGQALWDTGATNTCISKRVANVLNLIPLGKIKINTPSGFKDVNTYLIDVILPNSVQVKEVQVCDSEIGDQGIDFLIGMDIINLGDFAVSNYNNITTFSFRIPSSECTDYVKKIKIQNIIGKHGKGKRKKK